MPIAHVQYSGEGRTLSGTVVQIPAPEALIHRGPVIQVTVSVAQSLATQLLQQGQALPAPIPGAALIDTGASSTCVDEDVARQLGLPVVDVVQVASASHAATQQNVYPIHIDITGLPVPIDAPRAIGAPLAAQGIQVLIGRDVLRHATLFYNGTTGEITLAF